MRISVTGTRTLSNRECAYVEQVMRAILNPGDEVTVGCCTGTDALVARLAYATEGVRVHAVVPAVPSDSKWLDPEWRRYCHTFHQMPPSDEPYRARNAVVIGRGDILVGFPSKPEDDPSQRRSGTWMTIRMARRTSIGIQIHVLSVIFSGIREENM